MSISYLLVYFVHRYILFKKLNRKIKTWYFLNICEFNMNIDNLKKYMYILSSEVTLIFFLKNNKTFKFKGFCCLKQFLHFMKYSYIIFKEIYFYSLIVTDKITVFERIFFRIPSIFNTESNNVILRHVMHC